MCDFYVAHNPFLVFILPQNSISMHSIILRAKILTLVEKISKNGCFTFHELFHILLTESILNKITRREYMSTYFSEKFRQLRKSYDLTQEQIADTFHISPQAVSRWEKGTTYPTQNSCFTSQFFSRSQLMRFSQQKKYSARKRHRST